MEISIIRNTYIIYIHNYLIKMSKIEHGYTIRMSWNKILPTLINNVSKISSNTH